MAKNVVVNFIGNASSVKKASGETRSAIDKVGDGVNKAGKNMSKFVTLPIVGFLGLSTKAAIDERKEVQHLELAIKSATGARHVNMKGIEAWVTKMQNSTAFIDGDVRSSFGRLVAVLHDTAQAQAVTAFAADLARAHNVDLATATDALLGAETGRTKALVKMGIVVKDHSGKTMTLTQIMNANKRSVQGAAQAYAEGAGKTEVASHKFQDMKESIGNALIPVIDKLTTWVNKLTGWFDGLSSSQKNTIVMVALVVAALGPALTIFGRLISVVKGVGAAMDFLAANPIVLALAAIGVAIALLITHWDDFKRGVSVVWEWVKRISKDAANFIIRMLNDVIQALLAPLKLVAEIPGLPGRGAIKDAIAHAKIPSFDRGGTVPGPPGVPMLAMVHGQENISGPGNGGVIELHVHIGTREIVKELRADLLKKKRNSLALGLG